MHTPARSIASFFIWRTGFHCLTMVVLEIKLALWDSKVSACNLQQWMVQTGWMAVSFREKNRPLALGTRTFIAVLDPLLTVKPVLFWGVDINRDILKTADCVSRAWASFNTDVERHECCVRIKINAPTKTALEIGLLNQYLRILLIVNYWVRVETFLILIGKFRILAG